MRYAELANLVYFAGFFLLALVWPLSPRSKVKAMWIGGIGVGANVLSQYFADVLRDWLPVPLMALAYWQSGCFVGKPNRRLQALFESSEQRILQWFHADLTRWRGSWAGIVFELAYVLCYPVVPLGLAALYFAGLREMADAYWTVVLLSAYPCYALLPFVQLLPPRLVHLATAPDVGSARSFNLWLTSRVTHEANTFPSGHVAASTAIALTLLRLAPEIGWVFVIIAVCIAAACVVGRYHYVVDVAAAIVWSAIVFALSVLLKGHAAL